MDKKIIPAKLCYSHIGGRLGSLLAEHYIKSGWIKKVEDNERLFYITAKGKKIFNEMGIDLSLLQEETIVL